MRANDEPISYTLTPSLTTDYSQILALFAGQVERVESHVKLLMVQLIRGVIESY